MRSFPKPLAAALAFISGFGVLVLEVSGARLIAPVYGLSSIPWTAVITTVVLGLAVGNTLGGVVAHRPAVSLTLPFLGAAAGCFIPLAGAVLPETFLVRFGFGVGAVVSALVFFILPAIAMGTVTPILVHRTTGVPGEAGLRYGLIGAAGTAGAIAGTISTGLVLLPYVGLHLLLGSLAIVFALAGAAAAVAERSWMLSRGALILAVIAMPVAIFLRPAVPANAIFTGESSYASLRVYDAVWFGDVPVREFWQNGSLSSAEHRVTGEPTQFYKVALVGLLAEKIDAATSLLVLGGAANTLPTQFLRMKPDLEVTTVEIDPAAVEVARRYFSYGELSEGRIRMVVQDARPFLRGDGTTYDIIVADVYDNLYSVPWHLVTREAFEDMAARMSADGLVTLTLSTPLTGSGSAFLRRVVATMGTVFPHVRVYLTRPEGDPAATQEVLVLATREESDMPATAWPWVPIEPAGTPFRDDFAPVEYLQGLRFLRDPSLGGTNPGN